MMKQISHYEDYLINESGIILDASGALLRTAVSNDGILYTTINGNVEHISDLVYATFGNKDKGSMNVIHKDSDPLNNHITNLDLSEEKDNILLDSSRNHRKYSKSLYIYEVYNSDESDVIECIGRSATAALIQYEEISLKNMVGNGRKISLGPYAGYQIRRTDRKGSVEK